MSTQQRYSVDRLHEADAVLVDDDGRALTVPRKRLPRGVEERAVVVVSVDAAGAPDWSTATVDSSEAEKHKRDSDELSRRLRESDQYGFLHPDEEG